MSKLKAEIAESLEAVAAVTNDAEDKERHAYWQRDNALSHALVLHKQNGGMRAPQQVLADAQIFLNFLKGEVNE